MRGQEGGGEKRGGLEEERTRRGRERRVVGLKSEEESREVAVGSNCELACLSENKAGNEEEQEGQTHV